MAPLLLAAAVFLPRPSALHAAVSTGSPDFVTPDRNLVQEITLDPSQPCFVPTHPRVTTTLRFSSPIEAPEGRGFVEDEKRQVGEYLVSWALGDSHLTLSPLPGAGPLNLNISFKGTTFVFYFFPVEHQFQAVACLTLRDPPQKSLPNQLSTQEGLPSAQRLQGPPPPRSSLPLTPARLIGLLDRLKLLAASKNAPELFQKASAMRLEIRSPITSLPNPSSSTDAASTQNWRDRDSGFFLLKLMLVAADRRLDCIAFAVDVCNSSKQALAFNPSGFAARLGPRFLPAVISEAPEILAPGEHRLGYFVVRLPQNLPADLDNFWGVSLELVSPRPNPGAALAQRFARRSCRETVPSSAAP